MPVVLPVKGDEFMDALDMALELAEKNLLRANKALRFS